jgi:hypothetical protein
LLREQASEEGLPGDDSYAASRASLAKKDAAAAKKATVRFAASLSALAALSRRAKLALSAAGKQPRSDSEEGASLLLAQALGEAGKSELALCFALLDGLKALCSADVADLADPALGARRIVERYCFDRKLREALRGSGMHGDEAYRGVGFVKALLPRIGKAADPARVIEEFADNEELRSLLGFNLFNGVTWFNKERFEEAARMCGLFGAIVDAGSGPKVGLDSARCALTMIEAGAEAGYCFDGLEAALMKISLEAAKPAREPKSPRKGKRPAGTSEKTSSPGKTPSRARSPKK